MSRTPSAPDGIVRREWLPVIHPRPLRCAFRTRTGAPVTARYFHDRAAALSRVSLRTSARLDARSARGTCFGRGRRAHAAAERSCRLGRGGARNSRSGAGRRAIDHPAPGPSGRRTRDQREKSATPSGTASGSGSRKQDLYRRGACRDVPSTRRLCAFWPPPTCSSLTATPSASTDYARGLALASRRHRSARDRSRSDGAAWVRRTSRVS